ncbi:MAG: GNAT family N-acetyltransferase [Roseovarius sp.]|nr:GNAT family N-acetyltransferase [Roseovarius sp.]
MLIVEPADPRAPGPRALIEAGHALMQEMFPPEDNHFLDIDALAAPDIRLFAARAGAEVLGTGALALREGYGEIKAMFTAPAARGLGVGAALVRAIEDEARAHALACLRLETGRGLDAAIRLYRRAGFAPCAAFGDYRPNPSSVFMEKRLGAG